ncbi:MAG: hypothetical protein WBF17_15575 [Phycisphaerae bacterium]
MQIACVIACVLIVALCLGCDASGERDLRLPHGHKLLRSPTPVPRWWISRPDEVRSFLERTVRRGEMRLLATSPGGRGVHAVFYGRPEPHLRGKANWNSALAAGDPDAYYRRGPARRKRPVLVILAGVHGQEMEGMVAALSAISVMETGKDLTGRLQADLRGKLGRLRLIVIPLANPDGRARCPYDGWVALPTEEMTRFGQGTRRDGSLYGWPGCKAVHPMTGDVGILGAYFDDDGVNLMHDEWHAPMSGTTKALLGLVAGEGPDMLLNLHGHASPPAVLQTAYVPVATKRETSSFAESCYAALDAGQVPHGRVPTAGMDGLPGKVPPSFNLTSMFYHAGAALPMTFESPQGMKDARKPFDYPAILDLHHVLFGAAADWLSRPPDAAGS